jgi:predicted cobalt transporter CbtA
VSTTPFPAILRAVLVAALVAGGVLGVFHLVVSEPVVDRAIAWEESRHTGEDHGDEVFTRRQQKVGLIAGSVTYALALGLIFGGVYAAAGERLPGGSVYRRALLLAAAAWWVLFLAPFIRYPGNPPGVGSPDSVYERQALYVVFLLLAAAGLVVAGLWGRSLLRNGARVAAAAPVALGAYAAFFVALWLVMPANPDANEAPASILWQFRAASIAGSAVFWAVFGLVFAAVLRRQEEVPTATHHAPMAR